MPRVPLTTSISKSRGGRISTTPLGIAQNGVARGGATSLIPFINRDNSLQQIGQGLSSASRVIGGIAADKEKITNSIQDAAEAKAQAEANKARAEGERLQREMNSANAWEITKQVYQETRSLRDELIKRQGSEATGVNSDFVSGYQAILEARLKDQNDDVRKMVEKGNWGAFSKWENETHTYELQQQEMYKKNAFNSKLEMHIEQAADNLDNPALFDAAKDEYDVMLESKAQAARVLGGNPDQIRQEGGDIFHSNVVMSLLKSKRPVDADIYLKSNKNEMSKDGFEKNEQIVKPYLLNALASEKASNILLRSKGNPFSEFEALGKISNPEIRSKTKEILGNLKKDIETQEESLINEVTQAAMANNGVIPVEFNSKLTYAQALKVQELAAEWKGKQLAGQKKIDELTYGERDNVLNSYYMQDSEKTAEMSESDIVGLMRNIGADNQEQKSIRDTWIKAKNENSKEAKSTKIKELIDVTSADNKSVIDNILVANKYTKGTPEFDRLKLTIIERINAEGITKPSEVQKEAVRLLLYADQDGTDTAEYDRYAAYLTPIPIIGSLYNAAKDGYRYFSEDEFEQKRLIDINKSDLNDLPLVESEAMWSETWGEKPSNVRFDGVAGGYVQHSTNTFYNSLTGKKYEYFPAAPKKPEGLPDDAVWSVVPDQPGYGWWWSETQQMGYNEQGFIVRKRYE